MGKEQIKAKLLEAVRSGPYVDDIQSLSLFGSYVSDEAGAASDVDVLIDFTDGSHVGFFKFVRIKRSLSEAVGLDVDMVTSDSLSFEQVYPVGSFCSVGSDL